MNEAPEPTEREKAFIRRHRVARLATTDATGQPHVVPICYAYDGRNVYTALDHKPKRVPVTKLKRVKNIEQNARISVVIDDYSDDWSQLAYLIIHGQAELLTQGTVYQGALDLMVEKYPQYQHARLAHQRPPVIQIVPTALITWGAV